MLLVLGVGKLGESASSSRPVRSDADVGRASEWAQLPSLTYGEGKNVTGERLKWQSRSALHEESVTLGGDSSESAAHPLGRGNPACPLELELLW